MSKNNLSCYTNMTKPLDVPDKMMTKLGPCPKCQMHLKPCRCYYEDKCAKLEKENENLVTVISKLMEKVDNYV